MKYSISISELIKRPVLRTDQRCEMLNKMTDEEIERYEQEVLGSALEQGPQQYPDTNVRVLSTLIDNEIIYTLLKASL